jgi:transposase
MEDVASLKATIVTLLEKIAILEAKLAKYEHPKNSRNSSVPPSKDENRPLPNQSLRKVSDKKVGGQAGHKGSTLEFSAHPTEVIPLVVNFCNSCGKDLGQLPPLKMERRQVIDMPPIVPIIKEYQSFSTVCSCGHCNKATFPVGVDAPVQYGSHVESMVAYLSTRQFMPFARMEEYFSTVFQLPLSQGTIQHILQRMYQKALPLYTSLHQSIAQATCVGGDETSIRINGKKGWLWTIQNKVFTFIHCSDNRGFATLEALFPNGLPQTTIVHDAYAAWLKLIGKNHQLCLAHLLRELNYFQELYPTCEWVTNLKAIFKQAIDWKNNPTEIMPDFKVGLGKLLEQPPDENCSKIKPFVKRLLKHKASLFVFLEQDYVPADNNGSERALRNVKVKMKVSGQFKTIENAQIFAVLRSIIDTLIKNNQPLLPSLQIIAICSPE